MAAGGIFTGATVRPRCQAAVDFDAKARPQVELPEVQAPEPCLYGPKTSAQLFGIVAERLEETHLV